MSAKQFYIVRILDTYKEKLQNNVWIERVMKIDFSQMFDLCIPKDHCTELTILQAGIGKADIYH
jgi:hypothetical protein